VDDPLLIIHPIPECIPLYCGKTRHRPEAEEFPVIKECFSE
jgi:hypothetical protein